ISDYTGGYDDWQRERARTVEAATSAGRTEPRTTTEKSVSRETASIKKPRKLSNKERAELEALPKKIEALEAEQLQLTQALADPAFFKKGGTEVSRATARLSEIEAELPAVYARWEELEG